MIIFPAILFTFFLMFISYKLDIVNEVMAVLLILILSGCFIGTIYWIRSWMSKERKYFGMLESSKLDPATPFEDRVKFIKETILKTAEITSLYIMGKKELWINIKDGEDFFFMFIFRFNTLEEALEMKNRLD